MRVPLHGAVTAQGGPVRLESVVVRSASGNGSYTVTRLPSGEWTCPCPGFQYREHCRHVDEARLQAS